MKLKNYKLTVETKRRITAGSTLVSFFGYLLVAYIIYNRPTLANSVITLYAWAVFLGMGLSKLVEVFTKGGEVGIFALFTGFIYLAISAALYFREDLLQNLFPIALGVYLLLTSAIHFLSYFISRRTGGQYGIWRLFLGTVSLLVGGMLILATEEKHNLFIFITSVYYLLMALTTLSEFFKEISPDTAKFTDAVKRKIRIPMPVALSALIPLQAINKINESLRPSDDGATSVQSSDDDEAPDMEVFVHVSPKGLGRVGHVDICYKDTVMTYGSYDRETFSLNGLVSNGVLAVVEGKEKYLSFCIEYSNKSIFSFGIRLTKEQKEKVEQRIDELMGEVSRWQSKYEREGGEQDDYASVLTKRVDAKLYKFIKGGFRAYFVAGSNCAVLADRVVGVLGTDVLTINGFLTPGTYYTYLDREFRRENGIVISKRLYKEQKDEE